MPFCALNVHLGLRGAGAGTAWSVLRAAAIRARAGERGSGTLRFPARRRCAVLRRLDGIEARERAGRKRGGGCGTRGCRPRVPWPGVCNRLLPFLGLYALDEIDADLCRAFKARKFAEARELRERIDAGVDLRDQRNRRLKPGRTSRTGLSLGASAVRVSARPRPALVASPRAEGRAPAGAGAPPAASNDDAA